MKRVGQLLAAAAAGIVSILGILIVMPAAAAQERVTASEFDISRLGAGASRQVARGLVKSGSRIELRSVLNVPVLQTPFRDGEAFAKGDLLISYDCSELAAGRQAAMAKQEAARISMKTSQRLLRHGAAGKDETDLAVATFRQAQAETGVHDTRLEKCEVLAPFDGRVVALQVQPMELPVTGEPVLTIVDDSNLELEAVVPSHWLAWLKKGAVFSFTIDETRQTVPARVERVGAEIDPVSQTIRISGTFGTRPAGIIAGMSGTIEFPAMN
ncbi:MAG: HlyD family efflux transporter periplasmic adaptor subunit [Nitratireductor sp.]